jgi:hypothetical protein
MRMMNWVSESDSLEDLDFHAWADADFAGADLSKRSTNGGLAGILGQQLGRHKPREQKADSGQPLYTRG